MAISEGLDCPGHVYMVENLSRAFSSTSTSAHIYLWIVSALKFVVVDYFDFFKGQIVCMDCIVFLGSNISCSLACTQNVFFLSRFVCKSASVGCRLLID